MRRWNPSRTSAAGLVSRATTMASRPVRACCSSDTAAGPSRRLGQRALITPSGSSSTGMATMDTSSTDSDGGRSASRGRNPIRTTRRRRMAPVRATRNRPCSLVRFRPSVVPAESSNRMTAPGMGCRLALSRTVPRSSWARAVCATVSHIMTTAVSSRAAMSVSLVSGTSFGKHLPALKADDLGRRSS